MQAIDFAHIPDSGRLDFVHVLKADTVSELDQGGSIENLATLKMLETAKPLPVRIFV